MSKTSINSRKKNLGMVAIPTIAKNPKIDYIISKDLHSKRALKVKDRQLKNT